MLLLRKQNGSSFHSGPKYAHHLFIRLFLALIIWTKRKKRGPRTEPCGTLLHLCLLRWDEIRPDKSDEDTFIHLPADWGCAWKGLLLICQDRFRRMMMTGLMACGNTPEGRDQKLHKIWEHPIIRSRTWTHPSPCGHPVNVHDSQWITSTTRAPQQLICRPVHMGQSDHQANKQT